jgi:hypothetical protein
MVNPKKKYREQKDAAKQRGIQFNLTFDEWWSIWETSGKWEERGCRKGQYVMSRINDTGPYQISNVFIQTCSGNNSDAHKGRPKPKSHWPIHKKGGELWTDERKKQHGDKLRGRKQPNKPCIHCGIDISLANYGRHIIVCVGKGVSWTTV